MEMSAKELLLKRANHIYLQKVLSELRNGIVKEIAVTGFSMVPTIVPGQRVRIFPCNIEHIKMNDIIAYKLDPNSWITIHRVIQIVYENSAKYLKTKGDHMKFKDKYKVMPRNLLGLVEILYEEAFT
jgi:signal peptidase I